MGKGIILLFLSGGNANSNKKPSNNKGEKSPEDYGREGRKDEQFVGTHRRMMLQSNTYSTVQQTMGIAFRK